MAKNDIITQLLVQNILPLEEKIRIERNSKVQKNWFEMFGDEPRDSAPSLILNKFLEYSRNSELAIAATPIHPVKAPHVEVAKIMRVGQDFLDHTRKIVQNVLPTVNGPNSSIHVLEDGRVLMIVPEFEMALQPENDIFHVFCANRRDPISWGTMIEQLLNLGYIEDKTGIKSTLFTQGQEKTVTCLVLTPPAIERVLGKNQISNVAPSLFLVPVTTTQQLGIALAEKPKKQSKKSLAETSED
jgi:hypothetical protein